VTDGIKTIIGIGVVAAIGAAVYFVVRDEPTTRRLGRLRRRRRR